MKQIFNFSYTNSATPEEGVPFTLYYKDVTFVNCYRQGASIQGRTPSGEILLTTTTGMILQHDLENQTITRWRYE